MPQKYFIAIILLPCFFQFQPVLATALEKTESPFRMVELTPGTMLITNKSPERDPFNWPTTQRIRLRQIAEAEENIFADFSLQGIVWNRSKPQAIINRQLVTIGDMVDGALITNITQTKVSLTKNAKKHSMQFDTLDIDFGNQSQAKGKR